MSANPFTRPFNCSRCHDTRHLTRSARAHLSDLAPCPVCGSLPPDEYERFKRDAWSKNHTTPAICELDLNPAEFLAYQRMRAEHPNFSKLTVLTWIEGQRYDPSKDPTFLPEIARLLPKPAEPASSQSHQKAPRPQIPPRGATTTPESGPPAPPPPGDVRNGLADETESKRPISLPSSALPTILVLPEIVTSGPPEDDLPPF